MGLLVLILKAELDWLCVRVVFMQTQWSYLFNNKTMGFVVIIKGY
jgi:hypothetical protein